MTGSDLLKEAAAWFYSLDHSPSAAGYNLFSRALDNATRSDTPPASVTEHRDIPDPHCVCVCVAEISSSSVPVCRWLATGLTAKRTSSCTTSLTLTAGTGGHVPFLCQHWTSWTILHSYTLIEMDRFAFADQYRHTISDEHMTASISVGR